MGYASTLLRLATLSAVACHDASFAASDYGSCAERRAALSGPAHVATTVLTPSYAESRRDLAGQAMNCTAHRYGLRAGIAPVMSAPEGSPFPHAVKLVALRHALTQVPQDEWVLFHDEDVRCVRPLTVDPQTCGQCAESDPYLPIDRITNLSTWPLRGFLDDATCRGAHVVVIMQSDYCTVRGSLPYRHDARRRCSFLRIRARVCSR